MDPFETANQQADLGALQLQFSQEENFLIGACEHQVAGEILHLLPQKAVWWAKAQTLLVADVHIGKAATFRHLGVPVPSGTTADTLRQLSQLMENFHPKHLIVLGDLLHHGVVHFSQALAQLRQWRVQYSGCEMILVRGNHDRQAGDPPANLAIQCVAQIDNLGPFAARHEPETVPGAYVLAGHVHPAICLRGRGRDRVRLPCFYGQPGGMVLPAFGAFTGMYTVQAVAGCPSYMIAENRVLPLPDS
jgi:uncharacterized protein